MATYYNSFEAFKPLESVLQTLCDCKPLKYVVVQSKHLLRIGNHGNI